MSYTPLNRKRPFHLVNGRIMYESATAYTHKKKLQDQILDNCYSCNYCCTILLNEDVLWKHYDRFHKDKSSNTPASKMDTEHENGPSRKINKLSANNKIDETSEYAEIQSSTSQESIMPAERLIDPTVLGEIQEPISQWVSISSEPQELDCLDNIFSNDNMDMASLFSQVESEANSSSSVNTSDFSIDVSLPLPSENPQVQDECIPLPSQTEPEAVNTDDDEDNEVEEDEDEDDDDDDEDDDTIDDEICEPETSNTTPASPASVDADETASCSPPVLVSCELDEIVDHRTMPRLYEEVKIDSLEKTDKKSCYVEVGEISEDEEDVDKEDSLDLKDLRESKWFWCKVCDNYLPNLNELRKHVQAQHNIDPSQINRYNYVTYDLEIARTIQNFHYFKE